MKRYGKTAAGRIGTAAMLRALSVLIRHHPGTALDMAGAGLKQAGRSGWAEVKDALTPSSHPSDENRLSPDASTESTVGSDDLSAQEIKEAGTTSEKDLDQFHQVERDR